MQEPNLLLYPQNTLSNRLYTWFIATRPAFFTASVLPVLVGLALSWHYAQSLRWDLAGLAVLAIVLIHAGANVLNDYHDAQNGTDSHNQQRIFPFSGGSRFIQNQVLNLQETRWLGLALLAGGALLGLLAMLLTGPWLLLIGGLGALLAVFYSAPPCLACKGLGDLSIVLSFGVLPVVGVVWMQLGSVPASAWWLGGSIGVFTAAILWVNSIPDIQADRQAGKWTWPARLGAQRAAWGLPALFALGFSGLWWTTLSPPLTLYWLALLPAVGAVHQVLQGRLLSAIPLTLGTHSLLGLLLVVDLLGWV